MACFQQNCYCQINPDHFKCKESDWEEILEIPGISNVTLMGNDSSQTIKTCKIVIASLGSKFESLLGKSVILLDYPISVVKILHEFTLTGKCNCNASNIELLLKVAKEFNISGIKMIGGQFLVSLINLNNVHEIYQIANKYLCRHYNNQIKAFILNNFEDLGTKESFLKSCSPQWMEEFVKHEGLNATEENIFKILKAWAEISPEKTKAFPNLTKFIRFGLMEHQFFMEVVKTCPLLENNPFVEKANKTFFSGNQPSKLPKSRIPNELIFAIGGFGSEPTATIEVFNLRAKFWSILDQNFAPHAYHGMIAQDNKIFVFGGFGDAGNGPEYFQSTYCLDLSTQSWTKKTSMHVPRCYVSVAELNGKFYSIGGYNGTNRFSSVECYDPATNQWTMVRSMNVIRSDATAVSYNNKIYCIGGFNGDEILQVNINRNTSIPDIDENIYMY